MEPFYRVNGIPVHSVLLMPTREKALNYPRRDLELGFCPRCGFICNTLFDPEVHEYGTSCEESQGFSATFNGFSRRLAKRWVTEYGLRGKSVLEIGCGKGDFLAQHWHRPGIRTRKPGDSASIKAHIYSGLVRWSLQPSHGGRHLLPAYLGTHRADEGVHAYTSFDDWIA